MTEPPNQGVEYFCYIFRSKVDQLFQTLMPGRADEWTEHSSSEQDFNANLSADWNLARIVSLFKGALRTGAKVSFSESRK